MENKPCINPIEDQRRQALYHYNRLATVCNDWSGFVEAAIKSYNPLPSSSAESKEAIYMDACKRNSYYPTSNEKHTAFEAMESYSAILIKERDEEIASWRESKESWEYIAGEKDKTISQLQQTIDEMEKEIDEQLNQLGRVLHRNEQLAKKVDELIELNKVDNDRIFSLNIINEELRKERGELIGFLKAHEQWEADFIGEDSKWWPHGKNGDVLQGKLYESFLELQSKRNALLNDVMEKNG